MWSKVSNTIHTLWFIRTRYVSRDGWVLTEHLLCKLIHRAEHVKLDLSLLEVAGPLPDAPEVCQHCWQCVWILDLSVCKKELKAKDP